VEAVEEAEAVEEEVEVVPVSKRHPRRHCGRRHRKPISYRPPIKRCRV